MGPQEFFELAIRVVAARGKATPSGRDNRGMEVWHYDDSGFSIGMVRHFHADGTEEPVDNLAILARTDGGMIHCFEVSGGKLVVDAVPPQIRGRLKELVVLEDMSNL